MRVRQSNTAHGKKVKMSYLVDAFVESSIARADLIEQIEKIIEGQTLGWVEDDIISFYDLSAHYLPENLDESVLFSIHDSKSKKGAQCLLWPADYAPEADIDLPILASERQKMIVDLIESIYDLDSVFRVGVALTDSGDIDEVKYISIDSFQEILKQDFEEDDAPPNVLYIFSKM